MVANQIEFVEFDPQSNGTSKKQKTSDDSGVKLLRGAPVIDLSKDSNPDLPEMLNKPLEIKKRVVEKDSLTEMAKFKQAKVDPERLLSGSETKHWKNRQKPKIFEYKTKKGVAYLREPETEWTYLRNKNNWSESKIKEFHEKKCNKQKSLS